MSASGHGKPRNDLEWLWLQEDPWNSREGSVPSPTLGSACASRASCRLRSQPGANPSIFWIAICAFKKHMAWHNAGSGDNGRNVAVASYFQCLYAVVFTSLLLFCVLKSCCCLWIGQAEPQLLGAGRGGGRAFCSDLISREMPASPKPQSLTAEKPLFTPGCLEVLLPPSLLETNPSINVFILELCWIFVTAKATWQYWRIPTSCQERGNSSIVFSFHCLLVYKKDGY